MSNMPDLLERFRRAPEVLAMVLTGVFGEEIDFVPVPGKWSIRLIIAHLADSEIVGTQRFRQVIAEENPTLGAYDQNAWAENLDYARRLPKSSLESFRRVRAENYELLKALPESAYARIGMHVERGPLTLERLLEMYTEHTESHAGQMQALRDEYKKSKGK
jgi:hypothetical protein